MDGCACLQSDRDVCHWDVDQVLSRSVFYSFEDEGAVQREEDLGGLRSALPIPSSQSEQVFVHLSSVSRPECVPSTRRKSNKFRRASNAAQELKYSSDFSEKLDSLNRAGPLESNQLICFRADSV